MPYLMNFESSTVDDSVVFGKFNKYDKNLPKKWRHKNVLEFYDCSTTNSLWWILCNFSFLFWIVTVGHYKNMFPQKWNFLRLKKEISNGKHFALWYLLEWFESSVQVERISFLNSSMHFCILSIVYNSVRILCREPISKYLHKPFMIIHT